MAILTTIFLISFHRQKQTIDADMAKEQEAHSF
jgi:hypothetical protein